MLYDNILFVSFQKPFASVDLVYTLLDYTGFPVRANDLSHTLLNTFRYLLNLCSIILTIHVLVKAMLHSPKYLW